MYRRKLGIVIGTNEYSDSGIRNLRFSEKDARDVKNILLSPGICEFDKVVESISELSIDTFGEIEQMLSEAEHDDLFLIYFSGHGQLDRQNELCLLFKNTKVDRLLATSLNYSMITKCIKDSKCRTIIIILDCCYSGAAGVKGNNVKEIFDKNFIPVDNNKSILDSGLLGSGTVILTASSEFDVAKEDNKLGNGVFTYYLIEGLKSGAVAGDSNGDIDLEDIYDYAYKRTKMYSQTPHKKSDIQGKILIGKNPLKVKEYKLNEKKNKLVRIFRKDLPTNVYNKFMIVLVDAHEKPEELTEIDKEINSSLEDLLAGNISVKAYIPIVQCYLENDEVVDSYVLEKYRNTEIPKRTPENSKTLSGLQGTVTVEVFNEKRNTEIPKTFTSPFTGIEFVLIPAGKFMMGSPSNEKGRRDAEDPVHEVIIKNPFYMGNYPVTQKQWEKVMGNNPSRFKGEDRPVQSVSWNDVKEFIKKLNEKESTDKYRLPSESEWEYTCRAGTTTRYSFGNDESKLDNYAWYSENSNSETHPVGLKNPNPWGLFDMNGNVWEWCQDSWHGNYDGAPSDGSAWESEGGSSRVIRGGCWSSVAWICRSANRNMLIPGGRRISFVGFRLLRKL